MKIGLSFPEKICDKVLSTGKGIAMSYESQMINVLETKLATEKVRIEYALSNNAPACLVADYIKEAKRIERHLAKLKKGA